MEFFDKLGKKATEAYKITADKTGKIAKETKLKLKMSNLRTQVNDLYEEIGKKVYEEHIREEKQAKEDIEQELEELCTKVDVISDEIEDLLKQCLELRDKKQCKNCYVEIDKEYKYCPNCGAKQDDKSCDDENDEEDYQNVSLFDSNNNENESNNEEKTEENNNMENLEKTVKIESNVEENEEDEIEDNNNEDNNNDDINMY